MKRWLLAFLGGSILVGVLIIGCTVYQDGLQQKSDPAPKKEAAVTVKDEQKLIPEDDFKGVLERFKRRDCALDLEQAHVRLYNDIKAAALTSQGNDLDAALYGLSLSYLDQLSEETARAVLAESEQPEHEKNIRELTAFSSNAEKARMIVLFEMEYLKSDGLVSVSD